jgi:hypothetical protein
MKTALEEASEDARHYFDLWKAAEKREARLREKADAWDALVALLPTMGEWERGRALAADGRLMEWVLRERGRDAAWGGGRGR